MMKYEIYPYFIIFQRFTWCAQPRPALWGIKKIGCAISGGYRQTIEILQTFFASLKVCLFAFCEIFELVRNFSIFRIRLYRRDLVELLKNVFTKFDDSSIQPRTDLPKFWRLLSKNTKEPAPTRLDHNFAKSARIRLRFCSLFASISQMKTPPLFLGQEARRVQKQVFFSSFFSQQQDSIQQILSHSWVWHGIRRGSRAVKTSRFLCAARRLRVTYNQSVTFCEK